jgi:hypothetical protein
MHRIANLKGIQMVTWESRAWLTLWSMCPPYLVYFAIQLGSPGWPDTMWQRILCLAAAALTHAAIFGAGFLVLLRWQRAEGLLRDERDLAIDARATRGAYWFLFAGAVIVGMMMPFRDGGWRIVNATLLTLVVAETLRNALIVVGYREKPQFAH